MAIRIELKPAALQEWLRQIATCPLPERAAIWIGYDTDGCGCAVNGVIVVRWTEDQMLLPRAETWVEAMVTVSDASIISVESASNPIPYLPKVFYEPRSEWVFDEVMRLDFEPTARRFQLRSDNQIFCM